MGGFVIVGNTLFATIENNYLKAVELNKGTIVDSVKGRNGSLIFGDNKFICYGNNGEVNLINYDQKSSSLRANSKSRKGAKIISRIRFWRMESCTSDAARGLWRIK